MNTIKLENKGKTKIIAHRGLSGIECENTLPAFIAAANRSYFGIETDVHITADKSLVVIHDDKTDRVSKVSAKVYKDSLKKLRELPLKSPYAPVERIDVRIPLLLEYAAVCRRYEKKAILELKDEFSSGEISKIIAELKAAGVLEDTVFISFHYENLIKARRLLSDAQLQFLISKWDNKLISRLKKYKFGLDIYFPELTAERIAECHENSIEVNCWTVDDKATAERLISWGIDYITSNILE